MRIDVLYYDTTAVSGTFIIIVSTAVHYFIVSTACLKSAVCDCYLRRHAHVDHHADRLLRYRYRPRKCCVNDAGIRIGG